MGAGFGSDCRGSGGHVPPRRVCAGGLLGMGSMCGCGQEGAYAKQREEREEQREEQSTVSAANSDGHRGLSQLLTGRWDRVQRQRRIACAPGRCSAPVGGRVAWREGVASWRLSAAVAVAALLPLAVFSILPAAAAAQTATALRVSLAPNENIVPGVTTVNISYQAVDANGDLVTSATFSAFTVGVSWSGGSATDGDTIYNAATGVLQHKLMTASQGLVSFDVQGTLTTGGAIAGVATAIVTVNATQLALRLSSGTVAVVATDEFTVSLFDVDDFGNVAAIHELQAPAISTISTGFSAEIVAVASPNMLRMRVVQALDNATAIITISDRGLSGAVSVPVSVVSDRLSVRAPSTVTALVPFAVEVVAEDEVGNVDVEPLAAAVVSDLTPGFSAEIVDVVFPNTLSMRLLQAVDNTTATISISAQGLSSAAIVLVSVVADRLAVSVPSTATALVPFAVEVAYEDAAGNVDVDHQLGTAVVDVLTPGFSAEIVDVVFPNTLSMRLLQAVDNTPATISISAQGLSSTASVLVRVVADRLAVRAPSTATALVPFAVEVVARG